jgi:hypothetical protein
MSDRLNILATGKWKEYYGGSGTASGSTATVTSASTTNLTAGMKVTGHSNIPENTFIKSIDSSSQITLSKATTGSVGSGWNYTPVNYDVPTNPHMNLAKTLSSTDRLYTGIFGDDSNTSLEFREVGTTTANTERENLATTEGYKIKCYDSQNSAGVQLIDATTNYSDSDFSTNHYFVLLHSDDHNLHHFARVTQVTTDDTTGDSFEFEPRLGEEIPKGTKFMLFKGPTKASSPLAISAGIKMNLQFDLYCSRPLFYFFDDSLDKDGELNHGTKYYSYCQTTNSSGVIDLDAGIKATFLTVTEYAEDIVDYSRYNLRAKVVDNLKTLDAPQTNTSNEAHTVHAVDFTDYDKAFPNARRDDDDDHTTLQFRGPRRYLHYKYSPDKSNQVFGVFDNIVYESYGNRGGYAETKIADMFRIQNQKISDNEPYRVRHVVHRADLEDWFDLDVAVLSAASPTYTFTTDFDLGNFLNANDEIKIGSRLFIIDSIGSFTAATGTTPASQPITLKRDTNKYNKLDNVAGVFSNASDPTISVGDKLYRRAYNRTDNTLLTDFPLVDGRFDNLFIRLVSKDFSFLRVTVTAIDVEKKLMTLAFINKTYGSAANSALDWVNGEYEIEIEKFNGTVETIDSYQENGQRILEISGRNNYSKLLSPAVNKNTLHSQDIIYSSNSPYNKLEGVGGAAANVVTCSFDSKTVDFSADHNWPTGSGSAGIGKHLFIKHSEHGTFSYIGKISSVDTARRVSLENYSLAESSTVPTVDDFGWYASTKHYVFNKALSTNSFQNTSTDLTATSNKGLIFESGQTLTSAGAESATLIGTSASDDVRALGYYMSDSVKMANDSAFQVRLDDNASSKTYQTFDTINTLIDFSILSIKSSDNQTLVEIAPHIPLTLGRVDINYANTQDTTFATTTLGTCSVGTIGNRYLTIDKDSSSESLSTTSNPRKYHNQPVYAGSTYIGKFVMSTLHTDHDTIYLYLDKPLAITATGLTINVLGEITSESGVSVNFGESEKLTHELSLLNAGHLHSGKIICSLSPHIATDSINKTVPLNYRLYYGTMDEEHTSSEKFGSPYFRIINLEKGNYNKITQPITTDIEEVSKYYLEKVSKVPYYASAYKFNLGYEVTDSHITGVGKTGNNTDNHSLIESRGFTSVYGSRFFDTEVHVKNANAQRTFFTHDPTITNTYENTFISKDYINQIDYKVARMFLFSTCDLLPYSSKRYDSLMYGTQTRDISNYNLFALEQPIETSSSDTKETALGKTNTLTLNDSNYSSASIISADRTISDLKRFSIMRLTEVVFDWAFNQIDPENIISKDRVLPKFNYTGYDFDALSTLFASTGEVVTGDYNDYTVTGCSYNNGTTITHSSNTSIKAGMPVSGDGIPTDATIASITDATHFELSATTTGGSKSGETLTFGSYIATDTSTNPNTLTGQREIIVDSNGRYIGEVAATEGSSSSWKIVLMDKARKTNGTNYFAGSLFSLGAMRTASASTDLVTTVTGHGKEDTFAVYDKEIQMLKSAVMYGAGGSSFAWWTFNLYGESGSSWHSEHGQTLGNYGGTAPYAPTSGSLAGARLANTFFPISFPVATDTEIMDSTSTVISDHPSKIFELIDDISTTATSSAPSGVDVTMNGFLPIFLDRFDIEDGGGTKVSKGTVGAPIDSLNKYNLSSTKSSFVGLGLLHDFASFKDGVTNSVFTYDKDADGVMIGFKPRLYIEDGDAATSDKAAGNQTVTYVTFDLTESDITSIDYFDDDAGGNTEDFAKINRTSLRLMNDLTGCYLVSEKGKYYDDSFSVQNQTYLYANNPSINEQTPDNIYYVISHEIDTTNTTETHILTLDTGSVAGHGFYRIMQPNHVCFYDFSPKKIRLNTLSSAYTKVSGEDNCYTPSEINSYLVRNKSGDRYFARYPNTGGKEAALSMYMVLDPDAQSDSNYVMLKDVNDIESVLVAETDYTMAISDGDNVYKTSMTYTDNGDAIGHFLTFDKMKESLGVVSISEPITLTVNGNLSIDAKRGMIGTVANICYEGDELINDLLESNDIEFTSESSDFPYFLAPNYKGVDLFSAINLILSKKEKTLIEKPATTTVYDPKESTFSLVNKTATSNYPKVLISDNGDTQIYKYKKAKTLFDFYNEIIVYGKVHKGIRKNLRSIQKVGRKTLEVYEKDLTSQEAVNERAGELLRVHSGDNVRLNIRVGHNNISQLQAGDVVQVELVKEGIELDEYIVLQIQHNFLGMMDLELGKYSKQLEDRFAELLSDNKKINADIRAKEFDERSTSFDILDSIDIKVSKLLVRKVSSSGGATLGFGSALNTSTTPMGFSGGSTDTITNLVEEEY